MKFIIAQWEHPVRQESVFESRVLRLCFYFFTLCFCFVVPQIGTLFAWNLFAVKMHSFLWCVIAKRVRTDHKIRAYLPSSSIPSSCRASSKTDIHCLLRSALADSSGQTTLIESAVLKSVHTLGRAQATRILSSMVMSTVEYLVQSSGLIYRY